MRLHSSLHTKLINKIGMISTQLLINICEITLHSYYLLSINVASANDVWMDLILLRNTIPNNKKMIEHVKVLMKPVKGLTNEHYCVSEIIFYLRTH